MGEWYEVETGTWNQWRPWPNDGRIQARQFKHEAAAEAVAAMLAAQAQAKDDWSFEVRIIHVTSRGREVVDG